MHSEEAKWNLAITNLIIYASTFPAGNSKINAMQNASCYFNVFEECLNIYIYIYLYCCWYMKTHNAN